MTAIEHVEFKSHGNLLRGRFYTRTETVADEPLVVMLTGDGSSGSKSSTYEAIIPKLLDKNLSVFIFDFAGKGYSEGNDSTLTIQRAIDDLTSAMEVVGDQTWVDQKRVGIFGSSFGGHIAVSYAGQHNNRVKAMALKSPAVFYPEVYELWIGLDGIQQWESRGFDDEIGRGWNSYLEAFDHNAYKAAKSISAPVVITHGSADTDVPISQSYRLAACWKAEAKLVVLEGVDHSYKQNNALETAANVYADWLGEKL